jgi:hypothetical protein
MVPSLAQRRGRGVLSARRCQMERHLAKDYFADSVKTWFVHSRMPRRLHLTVLSATF